MKLYVTIDPRADERGKNTLVQVYTEEAVLKEYGPYWLEQMRSLCGEDFAYNEEMCLATYLASPNVFAFDDAFSMTIEPDDEDMSTGLVIMLDNEEVKFDE